MANQKNIGILSNQPPCHLIMNAQVLSSQPKDESRFRDLIQQAPVAIFKLKGPEMVIEVINDEMLKLLGKTSEILGMKYRDALPELKDQPFFTWLDEVFATGETYRGNETKAILHRDGIAKEGYYNFIYQAVRDSNGVIEGVTCVANDVTDQVFARKKVERAEENLRMAIDAAELGSYYINTVDRIFVASPKLKEFFGFEPDEEVPYEAAINQIHEDYRQAAADLVEAAITRGVRFDMEYPVVGYHDGRIRWVRGIGTVQTQNNGVDSYFTGVLHEITEKKLDELRKNDFIAMASHELKTPLTTMLAIVQLLQAKLKDNPDEMVAKVLDRAVVQVRKMNRMVTGFLNLSRLESGKILITKQLFDLDQLTGELIEESKLIESSHEIVFHSGGKMEVLADQDKISSVISNLISNAIKYSPNEHKIEVATRLNGSDVLVSVKDYGMGILQQDQKKIFDRYYRVESSRSSAVPGFGVGLYLSAEIIHRHDGKIWVESEIGKGSSFYFKLPMDPKA